MSVSQTIFILASEVETQLINLSESHQKMLSVLKELPKFVELRNLSKWDEHYKKSIPDDEDETSINYKIIDLLYELAATNLYGAFQKSETQRIYKLILSELKRQNIKVTKYSSLEKW